MAGPWRVCGPEPYLDEEKEWVGSYSRTISWKELAEFKKTGELPPVGELPVPDAQDLEDDYSEESSP